MMIDKGQISGNQFMFAVICFIQSSALLTAFLSGITLQDSWIVILFGCLFSLPVLLLFRELMLMFPDQNLIQMLETVYGPVIGKMIGAAYLWFFFTLASINLIDIGEFAKQTLMRETPVVVLLLMCILVAAMAVRNGIKLVTRFSTFFVIIASLILLASLLLVINQVKLENFLPMFHLPLNKYIQGIHIIITIPFGEVVAFLMITPNVKMTRRQITKYMIGGFLLGSITVLLVMMRDIAVLGNTMEIFTIPHLVSLRLVNLGPALSRMEILFAVVFIILLFFKISFLYYVSVLTAAQLFKVRAFRYIVISCGILLIAYGLTLYPSPVEHTASGQKIVPFLWTPFEILIPFLTFMIAKIKMASSIKKRMKEV